MSSGGGKRLLAMVACLVSCVFLTSGCGEPEEAGEGPSATVARGSDNTASARNEQSSREVAVQAEPFPSPATASGGTEGAADHIRAVAFKVYEGYERAIIEFGRSGKGPARVPEWTLTSPGEGGYVRLAFSGLSSTTAGKDFVGLVMDKLYVVEDPGGELFVDIFAIRPFRYRVSELPDPGRLAVDYRPAAGGLEHPVVRGEKTVILHPREAEHVSSPLRVRGYSRHFEGSPTLALRGYDGEVLASKALRLAGSAETWRYFESRLHFTAKDGLATLLVGGPGSRVATFQGVEVPIFLESD